MPYWPERILSLDLMLCNIKTFINFFQFLEQVDFNFFHNLSSSIFKNSDKCF